MGRRNPHLSLLTRALTGALAFGMVLLGTGGSAVGPAPAPPAQGEDGEESGLVAPLDPRTPLPPASRRWVEETLAGMSPSERVGQVLMVRALGQYYAEDAPERRELVRLVRELALGGVILFRSEAYGAAALMADLQDVAAAAGIVPLIGAADFEWGAEFRVWGGVPFPTTMAVGATGDPAAAAWMGAASARDARALGLHWIFAPVADVNVNPRNPVINVRAFGEDPELVGRMTGAFVDGAQRAGALATAKHFPGHGDTVVDSHIALPVLDHDRRRLEEVELAPFRAAIDAGVGSVMTAHVAVPALTADAAMPATLSRAVLTDVLRGQLGFRGLVVTDAMEMGGISRRWWSGAAAVAALAAGADMVLLPPSPRAVHGAVVRAVERGDLSAERLEEAVRAVLSVKARLGLTGHEAGRPELRTLPSRFAPVAQAKRAQEVADAAVTLLRDREDLLPLDARRWRRVVVVGVSDSEDPAPIRVLVNELGAALGDVGSHSIDGRTTGDEAAEILTAVSKASVAILAVRVRVRTSSGRIELPARQARYARMLADLEVPTVVVALGSPYAVAAFSDASTALVAYGWSEPLQRGVARAVTGAIPLRGRLPVSVPGHYEAGFGRERPRLDARLQPPPSSGDVEDDAGVDLSAARASLRRWVDAGAFPGAVYAVGHENRLLGHGAVGRLSYAADADPMTTDTLFDLASLTKVVVPTTVAMKLVEQGDLRLDYPVQSLVPEFAGEDKAGVTIRHLLTHTSGLPAYVEYFLDYEPGEAGPARRAEVLERIYATSLEAVPGTRYAYSDLGIILLGEILDRALGEPFQEFARREIFEPLGMDDTMYLPPRSELGRIPPTEEDPWRGRVVRGEVHDENTFLIGGVSSHAGLFSTAGDLAVFAQTLLNHGTYDHARILERWTVASWRRRQEIVPDSSRALGWDTAWGSERWGMFDPTAFGHTGFTGTSLWVDPTRELFVVLLTNRVHPTRDNTRHVQARVDFHEAVVRAVDATGR